MPVPPRFDRRGVISVTHQHQRRRGGPDPIGTRRSWLEAGEAR
jgi:hypothetical protein